MQLRSTRYFLYAAIWLLISLLWFFRIKNAMVGVIWLAGGLLALFIAFKLRKQEKASSDKVS